MTPPPPAAPSGFVESLRALGGGLLDDLHDRVELLSLELQEEKRRVVRVLVWTWAAMLAGALALAFASLAIVGVFWETARVAVLAGLAAAYAVVAAGIVFGLRRFLARQPRPFADTLGELKEDGQCIRGRR